MSNSREKIEERRKTILSIINRMGKVSVTELSKELSVTPVTIRTDLDSLERDGYLIRKQGGAVPVSSSGREYLGDANIRVNCLDEKRAIAERILELIRPGDTVFLNSGTTTQIIAEELKKIPRLTVLTNSLSIAMELSGKSSFEVVLLGGALNVQYGFMYGADAQEQLNKYQADWCILSIDGISVGSGVTTYHPEEAAINKMMFLKAKNKIIAADHSKIGRHGFSTICDITTGYRLITDNRADSEELREMKYRGVDIIIVDC